MNQRKFVNIILAIVVLVIIASGTSYFVFKESIPASKPTPAPSETTPVSPTPQQNPIVPTPTQTQTGKPSITVHFPKGREIFEDGKEYTIAWKSENAPADSEVNLFLERTVISGGKAYTSGYNLGHSLPPASSYKWVARGPGDYKVVAELRKHGSILLASDASDTLFKIVYPSDAVPSLKVSFPNGGEQFEAGKIYQIKWSSTNISPTAKIRVNYVEADRVTEGSVNIVTTTNTGTTNWAVPGQYFWYYADAECKSEETIVSVSIRIQVVWINEYDIYQETDVSDAPLAFTGPCGPKPPE